MGRMRTAKEDEAVEKAFVNKVGGDDEITQGDILYVNELKVEEKYRGMGLDLFLLDAADRQINSPMSLTPILIPFPLVYLKHDADCTNFTADQRRLADYYALLGFRDIGWPESGPYFVDKWDGYNSPQIENVCPKLYTI
ncbi:hypothetical protein TrVE_jg6366 [Triparma verrucosa]|uniref:N-acetyltransferase domain-containing protein n=1 Tax=Triparma verrucosa TaxID=1606542 RepID=A0A9W7BFA0_9STRA|nr:hypothetical protein TrVE_jg6366 [Triparma verrucosa]